MSVAITATATSMMRRPAVRPVTIGLVLLVLSVMGYPFGVECCPQLWDHPLPGRSARLDRCVPPAGERNSPRRHPARGADGGRRQ